MQVRACTLADLPAVQAIYAHHAPTFQRVADWFGRWLHVVLMPRALLSGEA